MRLLMHHKSANWELMNYKPIYGAHPFSFFGQFFFILLFVED